MPSLKGSVLRSLFLSSPRLNMKTSSLLLLTTAAWNLSAQSPLVLEEDFTYPSDQIRRELGEEDGKWNTDKRAFLEKNGFENSAATLKPAQGLSLRLFTGNYVQHPVLMKEGQVYYFSYVGRMEDSRPDEENSRLNGVFFQVNDLNNANAPAAGFVKGQFGVSASSNSGSAFEFKPAQNVTVDEKKDYLIVGKLLSKFEGEDRIKYVIAASVYDRSAKVPAREPEWQITSFIVLPRLTREAPLAVFFTSSTGGSSNLFDQLRIGTTYGSVTKN